MTTHKRRRPAVALLVPVLASTVAAGPAPTSQPAPEPPAVSALDQRFITHCVRRAMEELAEDRERDGSPYLPPDLRGLKCQTVVTLREDGHHRGTGISEDKPILDAAVEAGRLALGRVAQIGPVDADLLRTLIVEIEIVGDAAQLPVTGDVLTAGPPELYFEPGIHGLRLTWRDVSKRMCPSEIVAYNVDPASAVLGLSKQLTTSPDQLQQVQVSRFRTVHWIEREPGGQVVQLRRGLVVIPPDAVTPEDLDAACARIARYMVYRQVPSGGFSYAYEPSNDRYAADDSDIAQAGVAWALSQFARLAVDGDAAEAANRALNRFSAMLVDLPGVSRAGFIRTADDRNKLGVTALTCLGLADHPRPETFEPLRDKLIGGMLWLQRPSGKFITAFPPADVLGTQEFYPGEAMTALARVYELAPQQRIMEAFDRGFAYYRDLFRSTPSAGFAGWQIQGFARMAIQSRRDDFAQFAFEMADALVRAQLDESNCPWPDKHGAIAPYHPGAVGISTASYLQALCDALSLARHTGDMERARTYERAVRLGARFVMQLEFRPDEAYYVRSPRDTLGGVRTSLWDNILRIDNCAHALIALTQARRALFPRPQGE